MHKLHRLVRVVYALAFARIFHVIVKSFFFSFNCHRYLLSSVSFFLFSCLNDIWWFLHLVLNSVAVRPIYVSVFSLVVTLAWYTTSLRTVAPIANAHIFCASRVHPARSRDSCMCSGAKIKFSVY